MACGAAAEGAGESLESALDADFSASGDDEGAVVSGRSGRPGWGWGEARRAAKGWGVLCGAHRLLERVDLKHAGLRLTG